MSVVDQIRRVTGIGEQEVNRIVECETSQLEDLEEVETALKSIGVTLKPRFDVSLAARIGATSPRDDSNQLGLLWRLSFFYDEIRASRLGDSLGIGNSRD